MEDWLLSNKLPCKYRINKQKQNIFRNLKLGASPHNLLQYRYIYILITLVNKRKSVQTYGVNMVYSNTNKFPEVGFVG